jgi:hypothetical protein
MTDKIFESCPIRHEIGPSAMTLLGYNCAPISGQKASTFYGPPKISAILAIMLGNSGDNGTAVILAARVHG